MALYFKDTEITNIDNLVPQSGLDITDMWFGTTTVYTVWAVYEGTLPATLNANGDDMRQYQVYGNTGGVGNNTVNEFDKLTVEQYLNTSISSPTKWYSSNSGNVLRFPCRPNTTYTIKIYNSVPRITLFRIAITDSENIPDENYVPTTAIVIETSLQPVTTFQTGANTKFILLQVNNTVAIIDGVISSLTLTEGTTPPENYVPYGYEVDISTSDGTNTTTTPIYIGSDPLGKDEYVDYQAGKVYRRTANQFDKNSGRVDGYLNASGAIMIIPDYPIHTYDYISVDATKNFYLRAYHVGTSNYKACRVGQYDAQKNWIGRIVINDIYTATSEITLDSNCAYVRLSIDDNISDVYFGTALPETYIPYLQPTDPPTPLPALPTCESATIVDYAGESQATPEKVLFKYRKENF